MRKHKFKRRAPQNEEMSLQITSMADIFTILLVFLLKSYATGAVNVSPSAGTLLPEAQAGETSVEALKVEVSQGAVLVEGQPVASLKEFRFEKGDLQANGSSASLGKALEKERQRQLLIAKANSDVKVDPKIIVVSDQRAPYSTIKSVLASAALHGYTDFKLAVVKGE
ncbi:MAG: biopolymer transporter ExbD [Oligoflexia bacterium]|nr:biopolymer transporter ExbD [Oligoflexia bacterium]